MKSIDLSSAAVSERFSQTSFHPAASIEAVQHAIDAGNKSPISLFAHTPLSRKIELLIEFAARRHSVDTHWPLPGLVFNELCLRQNVEDLDMNAISSAIIGAYRIRLAPWHRAHLRADSFGTGFDVLQRCARDWQMRVLEQTAGQLEIPDDTVFREVDQWHVSGHAPAFTVALDFRQSPVFVENDCLYNTVVHATPVCYVTSRPRPRIVLLVRRIFQTALQAGQSDRLKDFCILALVQEAARLEHLGVEAFAYTKMDHP